MQETITIAPRRHLGKIVAQVTIDETARDDLTITEHPVELGAAITDHAYKNPAEVTIRCGWSNSSEIAAGDESYVAAVYKQLLALQVSRIPFNIQTGKRLYHNMLFRSLSQVTDEKTEATLMLTAICREIIIVQTQVTTVPPPENQKAPAKTGATQNTGTKQPDQKPLTTLTPSTVPAGSPLAQQLDTQPGAFTYNGVTYGPPINVDQNGNETAAPPPVIPAGSPLANQLDSNPGGFTSGGVTWGPIEQVPAS